MSKSVKKCRSCRADQPAPQPRTVVPDLAIGPPHRHKISGVVRVQRLLLLGVGAVTAAACTCGAGEVLSARLPELEREVRHLRRHFDGIITQKRVPISGCQKRLKKSKKEEERTRADGRRGWVGGEGGGGGVRQFLPWAAPSTHSLSINIQTKRCTATKNLSNGVAESAASSTEPRWKVNVCVGGEVANSQ